VSSTALTAADDSTVSIRETIPSAVAPATPARPRLLLLGTGFASAAAMMLMAGLIGIYVRTRADVIATGEVWLPSGVTIPLTQPNMMAITMVFSVLIMIWAIHSLGLGDRAMAYVALGLVLLMGFSVIAQTAYLLTIMELGVADDARAPLIYGVIGTHLAILGAAMAFVAVMTLRALGGEYSAKDREGVHAAGMFWYVTVFLYMVVWFTIYITK
jgi:heme/copper-type cytochrome/quinol oxidase subunit 3